MGFKDLDINIEYRSMSSDVAKEFYIPVLSQAVTYERAVGFFSSTILMEISRGLSNFIVNDGKIRLVASPKLSEEDIAAIELGYENRDKIIEDCLVREFNEPENEIEKSRYALLTYLITNQILDIKIAYVTNSSSIGIFHEKLGLLKDNEDNKIAFSGSLNDSKTGLKYNYESIDVFCDWKSEESKQRIELKQKAFDNIWDNTETGVEVIEFPNILREKLETYSNKASLDDLIQLDGNEFGAKTEEKDKTISIPSYINLFEYQKEAIKNWEKNNYQGIYDMATGTGKTITGISSAVSLYHHLNKKLALFIVCPYQHLVEQWVEDLVKFNFNPIIGHSKNSGYRQELKSVIFDYNLEIVDHICFICTNATFAMESTQQLLSKIHENILLIVDEAHNFGAMSLQKTLNSRYLYRLALSATLERQGDQDGTQVLLKYFGTKCIEYSLERAIDEKKLTPYKYYPIITYLSEEELDEYVRLSNEIRKCILIDKRGKKKLNDKGKRIAIQRSRVIAGSINKCDKLLEMIQPYRDDYNMLIYCGAASMIEQEEYDDEIGKRQIDYIVQLLGERLGMRIAKFTSQESLETRAVLKKDFSEGCNLQALVAIKCLDEGVNIPSIKTAFILASSTNPKEYIQRRGRVLRKFPGKDYAVIYDFITLPRNLQDVYGISDDILKYDYSLIKKEIRRMIEFKKISMNPVETDKLISKIQDSYNLDRLWIDIEENENE